MSIYQPDRNSPFQHGFRASRMRRKSGSIVIAQLIWSVASLACVCAFWISGSFAAVAAEPSIRSFMIMDVCIGADGKINPTMTPGMAGCTHRRDIAAGEMLPYHLHDFPTA